MLKVLVHQSTEPIKYLKCTIVLQIHQGHYLTFQMASDQRGRTEDSKVTITLFNPSAGPSSIPFDVSLHGYALLLLNRRASSFGCSSDRVGGRSGNLPDLRRTKSVSSPSRADRTKHGNMSKY